MPTLAYVSVFAKNIDALLEFYASVFSLRDVPEYRSPIFRALDAGSIGIGFHALEAYELLGLREYSASTGVKIILTFEVEDAEQVERLAALAVAKGGQLIKPAYETYYGSYQAVLIDPEGNVFRINKMLAS